ncbi:MAG: hypothetical protein ACTHLA_08445 [Asticcacaulis sp.]|uniref:hypothetical protein n=1 Tax=Asticcacaulis sp. TaxID=1872648 RepID=UPI003F7BBD90
MTPAQQQAASLAWQHAHPLTMVAISTIASLLIIALIVLIRWLVSASAWKYHPGGAGGFLADECVRWTAILIPYLALSIGFKIFVYDLHPEYNKPEVWAGFVVAAIAFRLFLRRLPFVKTMGRHIDAAKSQAKAARRA